jgi:hypothetical protein
MSKSRSDEAVPEFVDEDNASTSKSAESKDSPTFMTNADRLLAFQVIASMAETGISLPEAGLLLANEYGSTRKLKEARALRQFFQSLAEATAGKEGVDILASCRESFGKTFVSVEEALILSRLPFSSDPVTTLRNAAAVITHKMVEASKASRFGG